MSVFDYEFERLSNKEGFNRALGHFRKVSDFVQDFEDYYNLADSLNEALSEKSLTQDQMSSIVQALLVDKYGYECRSVNLPQTYEDFSVICEETKKWNGVDIVLVHFHPELGYIVINPKNPAHWSSIPSLKRNELLNVFVGAFGENLNSKVTKQALDFIEKLIAGKAVNVPPAFLEGEFIFEEEESEEVTAPAAEEQTGDTGSNEPSSEGAGTGNKRMTPFYSVPVTNELFHNGNVEAWKKVIQSYQAKHKGLDVYIFYEGERIHDIHALFKWGKVKHGSTILFAVAGENIKDVAKLQRYLKQGASPNFEAFLKFPVNKVLNLF